MVPRILKSSAALLRVLERKDEMDSPMIIHIYKKSSFEKF